MIELDGVRYHNVKSAVDFLCISRNMFYSNVRPKITAYRVAARGWPLYKEVDLEPFRRVVAVSQVA